MSKKIGEEKLPWNYQQSKREISNRLVSCVRENKKE